MVAGTAVMGIGLYFIFLRPPLLPEDLRYMALSAAQLDLVRPRLAKWLTHVFIYWRVDHYLGRDVLPRS